MRDIKQLHPRAKYLANKLVTNCAKKGLQINITECVRTVEEQDALYAKGRTVKGSIVTNAKGKNYSSMHQWGVAFDICRNDGKGAYTDTDGFFAKVGKIGQSLGLEWGGAWKSITDKPHFQLPDWGSTATQLRSIYYSPASFKTTWKAKAIRAKGTNIRESKSALSKLLGVIPASDKCDIIKRGKVWTHVNHKSIIGYCKTKYLSYKA